MSSTFKGIIEANGGSVPKVEYWGVKSLGYRIKKNRKAHYSLLNIDAPSAAVAGDGAPDAHQRRCAALPDRSSVEELEEGQSAMLQKRDRDDRGERGDRFDRQRRRRPFRSRPAP